MADLYARSNDQLATLIQNASAGDTIYLAAGTYDTVWLSKLGTLNIKIASLDEGDPAILTGLRVSGSNGITFSGLVFEASEGDRNVFNVSGANDIHFERVVVRGPDNIGSGLEVSPFMIRGSTNISVTDSEFYQVKNALSLLDVDGLLISGNSFHDIRCDGVRGGGVSNAVITNNIFTDFYPINTGGTGDHPDAIQFWSNDQDEPGQKITISDNLIYRGNGLPMQGIFIRDTYSQMPFENLAITGNVVLGGLYNGISVGGVNGGQLTDNIVIGMDGQKSWIRVGADTDFVIEDNFASHYSAYNRDTPYDASNLTIPGGTGVINDAIRAWTASGSSLLNDLKKLLLGDLSPEVSEPVDPAPLPSVEAEPTDSAGQDTASTGNDTPATDPTPGGTIEVQPDAPAPTEPTPTPSPPETDQPSPDVSVVEPDPSLDPETPSDTVTTPELPEDTATAGPEGTGGTQEPPATGGAFDFFNRFLSRFGDDVVLDFGLGSNLGSARQFGLAHRATSIEARGDTPHGQSIMLDELFSLHSTQATHSAARGLGRVEQVFSSVEAHGPANVRPAPTSVDTIFQEAESLHVADEASAYKFAASEFAGFGYASGGGELMHLGITPNIV